MTMTYPELQDAASAKQQELRAATSALEAARGELSELEQTITETARAGDSTAELRERLAALKASVEDGAQRVDALKAEHARLRRSEADERTRRANLRARAAGDDPELGFLRARAELLRLEEELSRARRRFFEPHSSVKKLTGMDGTSWDDWARNQRIRGRLAHLPGATSMCDTHAQAAEHIAEWERVIERAKVELAQLESDDAAAERG